ncbi:MAG: Uncharacterised protein [Cellulomonadaceae bacterium TMED98]|nr:MAG: Uncharacterised protein [Cellulomonadaceae bacterium TMED98]
MLLPGLLIGVEGTEDKVFVLRRQVIARGINEPAQFVLHRALVGHTRIR